MLTKILEEIEQSKVLIEAFCHSLSAPVMKFSVLLWDPNHKVQEKFSEDSKFLAIVKKATELEALIEESVGTQEFINFWKGLHLREKEAIMFFSKNTYLSIRKHFALDTIEFSLFKNIEEMNSIGFKCLVDFTKLNFDLDLELNIDSVREYKFKKIFEQAVEKRFPYFKASKENTQQNLYKNLAWLGVLSIINTPEQNMKLTNFELNPKITYPLALKLDDFLHTNDLYYFSSNLFSTTNFKFFKYFDLEEAISKELKVNEERQKISSCVSHIDASLKTTNSSQNKI